MAKKKVEETKNITGNTPEGFESFDLGGDFGTTVDFEKTPSVTGVLIDVRVVEIGKGKKAKESRVMTLDSDGIKLAVWESVKLGDLFDAIQNNKIKTGSVIRIDYIGRVKVKGRAEGMKDYRVFTKK